MVIVVLDVMDMVTVVMNMAIVVRVIMNVMNMVTQKTTLPQGLVSCYSCTLYIGRNIILFFKQL